MNTKMMKTEVLNRFKVLLGGKVMKFFRYMSEREFALLTAGVEIVGKRRFNARTTSSGVCFLAETVEIFRDGHDLTVSTQWCFKFLHGVVSGDVLVEFECDVHRIIGGGMYMRKITKSAFIAALTSTPSLLVSVRSFRALDPDTLADELTAAENINPSGYDLRSVAVCRATFIKFSDGSRLDLDHREYFRQGRALAAVIHGALDKVIVYRLAEVDA